MTHLPTGKLPAELLSRLLAEVAAPDPSILLGPGVGLDCAVIDLGNDRCLVAKSDPITFATDAIGWYAVHVNANDVATTGARPRWFLATLLLPEGRTSPELAAEILRQIRDACREIDAVLVGGHTEVTHGLERPVVCGSLLGEVARRDLIVPSGARPGDALLLTKGVAVEATALLAREKDVELRGRLDPSLLERARSFLTAPGLSVLPEARIAAGAGRVHAMHDPTEGGLATALHELADASSTGLEIDAEAVHVFSETRALCRAFGLDPWGVIASGALLLAVDPADVDIVLEALAASGIRAARIGRIREARHGRLLRESGNARPLPRFDADEISRVF